MAFTKIQEEVMFKADDIKMLGQGAKDDFARLCRERGISDDLYWVSKFTKEHLKVCEEVWNLWHTTTKFKVGDKVHVVPTQPTLFTHCIRATVTEVNDDGWGYRLRAFESDLPGIYMFNMWDKDLQPRVGKTRKPVPPELFIGDDDGD
jgi:hypothetical protein